MDDFERLLTKEKLARIRRKLPRCSVCGGKQVVVCEAAYRAGINSMAHSGFTKEEAKRLFGWQLKSPEVPKMYYDAAERMEREREMLKKLRGILKTPEGKRIYEEWKEKLRRDRDGN